MRPMRRSQCEIRDPDEVEAILCAGRVLTLATHDAEGPYAVPLDYAYRDGVVWIHCATEGRKLDALRADSEEADSRRPALGAAVRRRLVTSAEMAG
jgi:nitroimidazol reductase NimA-like FMN-containing flavoprotein (pyridoxamine 5'-phosphate oxidase superfamily)